MGQSMRFISEESSFVLKMWVWFVLVVTTLSFGGIIGLVWWVIVPFSIVLYFLLRGKKGRILNHFEIMDHPSCPQTISFYIQDALILLWSVQFQLKPPTSHLETLSSHFQQKGLEKIDMVVLASGGGGAEIFYQREFRKEKLESQVILTDLFPNVDRWRVMEEICSNQKITHLPRPVDALDCDVKWFFFSFFLVEEGMVPNFFSLISIFLK